MSDALGRAKTMAVGFAVVVSMTSMTSSIHGDDHDIKGFLKDEVEQQREWEEKLRALPQPDNLRERMRIITEEPHIAGLPGSKRVADYILSELQSFGLNAWIEACRAWRPDGPVPRLPCVELFRLRAALFAARARLYLL